MSISGSEIRRLEELARLELEPDERERLGIQLARIIGFVEAIGGAAPAEGEPQANHEGGGRFAPLDEDRPRECLDRGEVLASAPAAGEGFFRVPPVIETERG